MFIIEKSTNDDGGFLCYFLFCFGLVFVGGCSPQARPAAIRQCNPACRKPFSYCTQVSPVLEPSTVNCCLLHMLCVFQ